MLSESRGGPRVETVLVGLLLGLFLLTGIAYSLVVPPFETPDEIYHYAFARHLAAGNGLPVQGPEITGPWEQEGSQPPLYYALVGLATAGIDQSGLDAFAVRNPRANLGNPHQPGNKNFMLFSAQSRPLQGVDLALRVGRWISVVLGTFTVLLTYLLSRHTFPTDRWSRLLATALVATIPQFTFISASLSNDNMITMVSAAALVYMAVLARRDRGRGLLWWHWAGLGLLLGLAALSKLQGLGLLPLTAFTFLFLAARQKAWRTALNGGLLVGGTVLLVAGWWYARNVLLYGDPFGTENLLSVTGLRVEPATLQSIVGELRGLQMSFWGIFGWFSILLPSWTYSLFELLSVLAATGAVLAWLRTRRTAEGAAGLQEQKDDAMGIVWIWIVISLALLAGWISVAQGSQGRLLFPAISALAVAAVYGLRFWAGFLPRFGRTALGLVVPVGLWCCSVYALVDLLPESYGLGGMANAVEAVPADAQPIGKVYGDGVELVAARFPEPGSLSGEEAAVTLYFRTQKEQIRDLELFIHLLDPNSMQIGNVTTHPGWGVRPLTLWKPGTLYEDTYVIPLDRAPAVARLYVGFVDPESTALESEGLLPVAGGGPRIESRVVWTHYEQLEPLAVEYDSGIALAGVALGQEEVQLSVKQLSDLDRLKPMWVAMRFRELVDSEISYATSLRLYPVEQDGGWSYQEDTELWKPEHSTLQPGASAQPLDTLVRLVFPPDLPAGEYELRLVVYDVETLEPVVRVGVWEPELLLARLLLK
ncbi:MAG: DUF2142 domain-containing protein [Caldilineaceae bacterium]|nr:DUF2142 domain-containing protein [Caldilineaceae bacterium]